MTKKLVKHGNSAALVIDKPILDLLQFDMATELKISTDGKKLIIEKSSDTKTVEKALKKVNKKHSKVLSKLAK